MAGNKHDKTHLTEAGRLIKNFPCFASLTDAQAEELHSVMQKITVKPNEVIVKENDLVDSIYIILQGEAEVTRIAKAKKFTKRTASVPVAVLGYGEGIGLNDTGFYSTTGKRTATVTALSAMLLLRLDIKDLYYFLKKFNLELSMYSASQQMLRMRFIKQSLPFSKLSPERLLWLANHVVEEKVAAGEIIFKQGEEGNKCYLIRTGKVEIFIEDETNSERKVAILKPPVLFGEATLITRSPRNATARALEDTELLVLSDEHLSELIESESDVANMFMTLMVDRSRPLRNKHVTMHQRVTADGQTVTILKNKENGSYFKLSEEGIFVWEQLNGNNTMQEITLNLAEKFNVFAPDVVAALISRLSKSEFISNIEYHDEVKTSKQSFWIRAMLKIRRTLEIRFAFGDVDTWFTKIYQRYFKWFFSKIGILLLATLAISGMLAFVYYTPNIVLFFSFKHVSLLLILGLIPLSLLAVFLHELGHAFAVKAFNREVHYIGIGWYWMMPIAFTDTTDMWLASRKHRMLVNLAGVIVDMVTAGVASISILFLSEYPYIQGMLWLFALYVYIGAIRMLSPLQEMDGYYVLMDWVERPHLRRSAVIWLVKTFPKCLRHPRLFWQYKPELIYWFACLIYLLVISLLTLTVLQLVFTIIGIQSNPYISLAIPFLAVIFSSLTVIADIRNQAEE